MAIQPLYDRPLTRSHPVSLLTPAHDTPAPATTGAAAQAAAPSGKTFKEIADYLGFKPTATDTIFVPTDEVRPGCSRWRELVLGTEPARGCALEQHDLGAIKPHPCLRSTRPALPSSKHQPSPVPSPPAQAFAELAKQWGLKDAKEFKSPRYVDLLTRIGAYHIYETAPLSAAGLKDGQKLNNMGGTLTISKCVFDRGRCLGWGCGGGRRGRAADD